VGESEGERERERERERKREWENVGVIKKIGGWEVGREK
jgi:hypothetical protein